VISPRTAGSTEAWPKATRWIVAAAIAIGIVLRWKAASPLWLDEALSVNIAKLPLGDIPEALRHDGHPPLYYWLLHGWMKIFGDSATAVRSLSAIFSLASLPLAMHLARRLDGHRAGLPAVAVLGTSPFAIRYATEARMYSLMTLLGLLLVVLILHSLQRNSPATLIGIGVTSGAMLLTHYWAFPMLAACGLGTLWIARDRVRQPDALRTAAALAAGGIAFIPWLPSFRSQIEDTGTPWALTPRPPTIITTTMGDFAGGIDNTDATLTVALLTIAAVLAVFSTSPGGGATAQLSANGNPQGRALGALIAAVMGIGIVMVTVPRAAYQSRYAAVVFGLVTVLIGMGISRVPGRRLASGFLVLICAVGLFAGVRANREDRTQAGDIAAVLQDGDPNDLVVFCPDQLGPSTSRLLPPQLNAVSYPLLSSPDFVDWVDYAERHAAADPAAIAQQIRDNTTGSVWLVTKGGYRTVEGQCEALSTHLSALSGSTTAHVAPNSDTYETSGLIEFGP
jgi:mannosyltransferase